MVGDTGHLHHRSRRRYRLITTPATQLRVLQQQICLMEYRRHLLYSSIYSLSFLHAHDVVCQIFKEFEHLQKKSILDAKKSSSSDSSSSDTRCKNLVPQRQCRLRSELRIRDCARSSQTLFSPYRGRGSGATVVSPFRDRGDYPLFQFSWPHYSR